ncbi:MAG TPA: PIN domain-containing protein [Thermoanaerobaculia bacterium]|jgi:predicted nucleic acid-binding protein|nr:PIN domain-containing protein [Thermoanaerobaculia bacterium]
MALDPEVITAVDTNVVVAGLLSWHAHHEMASAQLIALLESQTEIVLPLPALVEAYSVMTRLPPPHRLSSKDALEILESSLRHHVTLIGLDGDEGWTLLQDISQRSIIGGTTYDGLILACARKGGARRLLTFNRSHFERIATEEIEIVVPGSPAAEP